MAVSQESSHISCYHIKSIWLDPEDGWLSVYRKYSADEFARFLTTINIPRTHSARF